MGFAHPSVSFGFLRILFFFTRVTIEMRRFFFFFFSEVLQSRRLRKDLTPTNWFFRETSITAAKRRMNRSHGLDIQREPRKDNNLLRSDDFG